MNKQSKLLIALGLGLGISGYAQNLSNIRPVTTGAPFLIIAPDARSGGMADQGVATTSDAFSQYWNAAKYPFAKASTAVGLNYTPYMNKITDDVFLLYGSFYTKLGEEDRSSLSASVYYFNIGNINLTTLVGNTIQDAGTVKPSEFSIDVAYGLKLSDDFAMAVTGRYIRSDLSGGFNSNSTIKAANSFAVDVSGYYQSPIFESFGDTEGRVRAGFAIQNVGPKLDYSNSDNVKSPLPTIGRLGAGYDMFLNDENRIGLTAEVSKILVPSEYNVDATGNINEVSVISGIGKSFNNKNGVMYSIAADYSYNDTFDVRAGYFHESEEQGGRQFMSVGVGMKYQSFGLDLSYLINTSKVNSALDNTLRFGLTWNINND